jgi:hypothetical protein
VVSGLTNGTPVTCTVHATNAAGDGPESAPSASVTPTATPVATYRPDAQIRSGGPFAGGNVYNTSGAGQAMDRLAVRGSSARYDVLLENDGTGAGDQFTVTGGGNGSGFVVRYFDGAADVTASVLAGTYQSPVVAPGAGHVLTLKVTPTNAAPLWGLHGVNVEVRSTGDPMLRDVVRAVTRTI